MKRAVIAEFTVFLYLTVHVLLGIAAIAGDYDYSVIWIPMTIGELIICARLMGKSAGLRRWGMRMFALELVVNTVFSGYIMIKGRDDSWRNADAIIVLGRQLIDGYMSDELTDRLDAAIEVYQHGNEPVIIVSGGRTSEAIATEADLMFRYLTAHGIDSGKIIKEGRAMNTQQNLRYSLPLTYGREHVVIVSSDYHLYRAALIAGYYGCSASLYPAETNPFEWPFQLSREKLAIVKFLLTDVLGLSFLEEVTGKVY